MHQAATLQAVVPVTDVVETVRHLLPEGGSETVSRNDYKLVQTPQVFTVEVVETGLCAGLQALLYRRCFGGGSIGTAGTSGIR